MSDFKNQCVVVTGSATGIGEACAIQLAQKGAKVVVMDFNKDGAEAVVAKIKSCGGNADIAVTDLNSWESTKSTIDKIANAPEGLHAIIHSAGGFPNYVNLLDCPIDAWDPVLNSNLRSMFYLLKACSPHMIKNQYGRFVAVSSMAARSGTNPNPPHYTAAKGGMLALTRQAAKDLGGYGITVNAVAPANVMTPRTNAIRSPERLEHIQKTTPLGRLAEAEEIANAIVFLASSKASYITGITMDVNGGATMI
jgi:NAD(P)-dependent dehydrogenase (short-subunit alcohol dehydrogenase family)